MRRQHEVGVRRGLVGGCHPGKVGDLALVGLGVVAVGVALAADLDRRREMHHEEPVLADPLGCLTADVVIRCDESRQADHTGIVEEVGYLDRAAEILTPFAGRETEVLADAMPHRSAVQHHNRTA